MNVKEFKDKVEELTNTTLTYTEAFAEFDKIDPSKSTGMDSSGNRRVI